MREWGLHTSSRGALLWRGNGKCKGSELRVVLLNLEEETGSQWSSVNEKVEEMREESLKEPDYTDLQIYLGLGFTLTEITSHSKAWAEEWHELIYTLIVPLWLLS